MFRHLFERYFDNTSPESVASRLRLDRFERLNQFLKSLDLNKGEVIQILDIGGDDKYWKNMLKYLKDPVRVTLLNLVPYHNAMADPRIQAVVGDGRDLSPLFSDRSFDVVLSNSVIEHVGTFNDQKRMANEIRRVGKAYFVQTPNRYFPLEPHFLIPFFQFFPTNLKIYIAKTFKPGWYRNRKVEAAIEDAQQIRLLSKKELLHLFPDGEIWEEKMVGLTKSFIVYRDAK